MTTGDQKDIFRQNNDENAAGIIGASTVNLGNGDNEVYMKGDIDRSTLITGSGVDKIEVRYIEGNSIVQTGAGSDELKVAQINNSSKVETGDGNDTITVTGKLGNGSYAPIIEMGAGDDTFNYNGSDTNLGVSEIEKLDGGLGSNDTLDLSGADGGGFVDYTYINGFETIVLGNSFKDELPSGLDDNNSGLRITVDDVLSDGVDTPLTINGNSIVDLGSNGNGSNSNTSDDFGGFQAYSGTGVPTGYNAYWNGTDDTTIVYIQDTITVI